MLPETERGSRPSGLFRVLLLRVVVQDILGNMEASGAAEKRSNGAAEQRGRGVAEKYFRVTQRDGARQKLVGIRLNEISERAGNVHFVLLYP